MYSTQRKNHGLHAGLSLVEIVMAIGLVSIGLVVTVGTMAHVREREKVAREQRLSWAYLEQLQAELSLNHTWLLSDQEMTSGWSDDGRLLKGSLPLDGQGFGTQSTPFVLAFGFNQEPLGLVDEQSYLSGLGEGSDALAMVAFWGERRDSVMEVQARTEFPAAYPASRRRDYKAHFAVSVLR